jgi:glutamine cyclotransferase
MKKFLLLLILGVLFIGCKQQQSVASSNDLVSRQEILSQKNIPHYGYRLIKSYPHDPSFFTEGLVMDNGLLYESTGIWGRSKLIQIQLNSGKLMNAYTLPAQYFGEGITVLGDKVYQLTYESNIGFVYDKDTLKLERRFNYPFEGWGLTNDGKNLILSNGSAALIFLNPNNFQIERYVIVSDGKHTIGFLNELEYIKGYIYANIYQTNFIAIISPDNGKIVGWIDLTDLCSKQKVSNFSNVLNGIAYLKESQDLLVTGKNWSNLYEIHLTTLN